jgi:hypothetical protein
MSLNLQNPTEFNEQLATVFSSMGVQIREAMRAQVHDEVSALLSRLEMLESILTPPQNPPG